MAYFGEWAELGEAMPEAGGVQRKNIFVRNFRYFDLLFSFWETVWR